MSIENVTTALQVKATTGEGFSLSHDAVIRVYDDAGNMIETHEHKGEFPELGPDWLWP